MAADAIPVMSIEAFLEWETDQEAKHDLHHGRVFARLEVDRNHASITPVLVALCVGQLRGKPCRYRDTDTKVVVAETGSTYYPDGLIACPPNYVSESAGAIDNPTVVFEVLSPSTWRFDREAKFDSCSRLESLKEYVLIHADTPRIEVFTRREDGKWVLGVYLGGTVVPIDSVGIALALDELYEEAVFEAL